MQSLVAESKREAFSVWFTGLPCSGKSTIAQLVYQHLRRLDLSVELLDGDLVRQNLTKDLGFSKTDRDENIRRIGFVCHLLFRNGVNTIVAAISPFRAAREEVRRNIGTFIEVYVNCPLEVCIQRDVKGMYKQALSGRLKHFTGISDPYEEPTNPEVILNTDRETPVESTRKVLSHLIQEKHVPLDVLTCPLSLYQL